MATWICPFCEARMNVKPQLVGETRPCAKCQQKSEIIDADAPPLPLELFDDEPKPRKGRYVPTVAPSPVAEIAEDKLVSAMLAQVLLTASAIASGFCIMLSFNPSPNSATLFGSGLAGLVSVIIAWPIYSIANESYRSRRLLEEILKRQK